MSFEEEDDGYYTTIANACTPHYYNSTNTVNLFGIIISYTMPKSSKGSHSYSVTFHIIDQSLPSPSSSISFMWFCNSLAGLHMGFKVGDVIRIERARVQEYNNFPQFIAKDNTCTVTIFHRIEDPYTGLAKHSLLPPPLKPHDAKDLSNKALERANFTDPAWDITIIGALNPYATKAERNKLQPKSSSTSKRLPKMWPQEIMKLHAVHDWTLELFARASLADPTTNNYHCSLHAVQTHIHTSAGSHDYEHLLPLSDIPWDADRDRHSALVTGKCDVVALVTSVVDPARAGDGRARMTIWDGTTNGAYEAAASFRNVVNTALHAPNLYDAAGGSQEGMAQLAQQLTDLRSKSIQTLSLLGSGVRVQVPEIASNSIISRLKPGMWVRIRNLYASVATSMPGQANLKDLLLNACMLRFDSHVCPLGPDYLDVRTIARRYFERLARTYVQNVPAIPSAAPAAAAGAAPPTTTSSSGAGVSNAATTAVIATGGAQKASSAQPAATARPALPLQSACGEPITPMSLVRVGPAPAKYCVRGRIESWWPPSVDEFVSVSKEQEGEDDADLMFALTVTDDQDTLQLLFSGVEAERFLNITSAADLLASPALRQQVHDQLQTCRDLKLVCDYKIKVFVHREKVVLGGGGGSVGPGAAKRGGRGMGNRRKEPVENSYTRKTKRMIVFDSVSPVLPERLPTSSGSSSTNIVVAAQTKV